MVIVFIKYVWDLKNKILVLRIRIYYIGLWTHVLHVHGFYAHVYILIYMHFNTVSINTHSLFS